MDNTEKYPEGCILDVFNETVVNGVEMCDIRIDTYIYSGYGDDYFWSEQVILAAIFGRACGGGAEYRL